MITVPEATEKIIKHSPFLEEALSQDLINLSALARKLKPDLEGKLYKNVSTSSIIMALKRFSGELKKKTLVSENTIKISDITVRSNITEFTFTNSPTLLVKQLTLLDETKDDKNVIVTFTQGVYETTLFASTYLKNKIERIFKGEHLRAEFKDLSSISLILPKESVYIPGIYYNILKILAWEGISFTEVISSYTELTIFLGNQDVDKAFSVLKNLNKS